MEDKESLKYLKSHFHKKSFSVIRFYKHFQFTSRKDGESEIKHAVGDALNRVKKKCKWKTWLISMIIDNFKILRTEELDNYWREKEATRAETNAAHQFKLYIYDKVAMEQQRKRKSLEHTANDDIQEQQRPAKRRAFDIPVSTSTEAGPSHLAPEANQNESEDDVENEDDSENNDEGVYIAEPYRSPRVSQQLQYAQPLAEPDAIDEFFNPIHESMLRLPINFDLGPVPEESFMIDDVNVTARFHNYKQRALQAACDGRNGLQVDTQLYEIAALSHILLLKPGQYGETLTATFGAATLDKLHSQMLTKALDHSIEFPDDIFLQISKMVTTLKHPLLEKRQSRLVVMSQLLSLACQQSYSISRVIVGLALLLSKLPNKPIVNISTISETEIWNCYHDPLLTGILGDPEKDFILRWVNKITPEGRSISSRSRPDAIISIFTQANYDKTIGHGEAKVAEPTRNNDALCRDLLRLATFGKDTVDSGTTSMAIGFQVHGFNIQFYLVEFKHEALYTMTELANIQVPDSLDSFSRLLSTDILNTLVRLNDLVVKIKENKLDAEPIPQEKKRKTLTTPERNKLLDKIKNRHRQVPFIF